jgi:threonine dehydrogenase-like Zn-dependent dehydrogenase
MFQRSIAHRAVRVATEVVPKGTGVLVVGSGVTGLCCRQMPACAGREG